MNFKKIFLVLVSIFFSFSIYQKQVNAETKIEYSNITEITDKSISFFGNNFSAFNYNFNVTLTFGGSYTYQNEKYDVKNMPYVLVMRGSTSCVIFSEEEIYAYTPSAKGYYFSLKTTGKWIYFQYTISDGSAKITKNTFGKGTNTTIVDNILAPTLNFNQETKEWISTSVYDHPNFLVVGTTQDLYYKGTSEYLTQGLIFKRSYPKTKIATSFVEVKKNYASDNRVSSIDYNVFFGSSSGMTDEEKEAYKNDYVIKYSTDQINWNEYSIADYDKNYMPYRFKKNETLYVITVKKDNDEIVDTASLTVDGIGKYYSSITNDYYDTIDEKQKMEEEYENSDLKDISTDDTTSNKADIVTKIKALILDKLPILEQIPRIYNSFHYDNDYEGKCINIIYTPNGVVKDYICRPNVQVDLSYFGVGKIDVINFNYVVQYRDTIIKYQRFFMYFLTFIALVRIVRGYFK